MNIKYWENVSSQVLNDSRAKVGYKVISGTRSFKPATDVALQRIRYKLGQITKREEQEYGCFAVFTTYDAAEKFSVKYGTHIILVGYTLCQEKGKMVSMWKKRPPTFVKNKGGKGYHAESSGITELMLVEAPRKTVLAEKIYVIGIIE